MTSNSASCFNIVTFDATDTWDALLKYVRPELDAGGLRRLTPLLKAKTKSVVVERQYIDKDYRDTFSHFHSKRFNTPSSRCVRLHFFGEAITESDIIEGREAATKNYIGYSVIRPTKPNCIGRTFLCHTLRLNTSAHISICREYVNLLGTRLQLEGFPFISQDSDATVCAESSLWMLLRYYSNRYPAYSEVLPFQITNLASNHAIGRRVFPSSGLYSWQMAEALRLQKFSPVVYSKQHYPHNFYHLLYTYIESGLPLLVTVPQHVVVGYGHVSNYAIPAPAATTTPTNIYTSHFNHSIVVSDDNEFPYQLLHSVGRAQGNQIDSKYGWNDIQEFIVPLPEKVFLPAEKVQSAVENVLKRFQPQSASLAGKRLLLRLFLTSARSFKRSLRERGMGHPSVQSVYRNLPLPHFVWVCEIANYAEYSADKKIVGEIVWDATRNANEPDGWIALHFPERLIYDEGSAFNGSQSLKTIDITGQNSYLIFQSNLNTL